ncbi:hypothetical protein [Humibacter sp.]|uniref:hypothetical protein n=1 Tax=Humibacter sp. TaxID=1940291 RepID=UPI002CC7A660|nr:hypothetical protein [Humibacter sp.]HVX08895.1 hypothetical protein [Humibacter sp.]
MHEDDTGAQDATGPGGNSASRPDRDDSSAGTDAEATGAEGRDRSDETTEVIAGSVASQTADTELLSPATAAASPGLGSTPVAGTEGRKATDEHPGTGNSRMPRNTAPMPSPRYGSPGAYPSTPERPRLRAGAIVWGLLVVAFAAAVIAVSATPDARNAFDAWQASLTPAAWAIIGVVALGVIVLLIAGVSAIRSAQRRADAAR